MRAAAHGDRGHGLFLSFSHGPGVASNPPGWARVYAQLGDAPLSMAAFKQAIRDGRTVVTNGPWLTFDIAGRGPGAVIDAAVGGPGSVVTASAIGAEQSALVGPDGVLAEGGGPLEYVVDGPTWLAAVARGPATGSPRPGWPTPRPSTSTWTAPGVARAARRGLVPRPLDGLQRLIVEHGVFAPEHRERRLADYAELLDAGRGYYRAVRAAAERADRADTDEPGDERRRLGPRR